MMTENSNLKSLEQIKVQPTNAEAKKAAVKLASEAFSANAAIQKQNIKQNNIFIQGFLALKRLIHSSTQYTMKLIRTPQLITAAVAVCIVTLTVVNLRNNQQEKITESSGLNELDDQVVLNENKKELKNNITSTMDDPNEKTGTKAFVSNSQAKKEVVALYAPQVQGKFDAFAPSKSSIHKAKKSKSRQLTLFSDERAESGQINSHIIHDNSDKFTGDVINPVKLVSEAPVSTFSVDVDTAAYAYMRRNLNKGRLPAPDSVRIEELINYFDYNYELPKDGQQPFKPTVTVLPTPWNKDTKLMHIGIKGHDIVKKEKPRANLVFLLDVSGSMNNADKLPLLKQAFKLMVNNLDEEDVVSIVTYAGRSATLLEPTKVEDKQKILDALENLNSGGSTAGSQGIMQAYALAEKNYDPEGVNRVILATDGDFNVGVSDNASLKKLVEKKRKTGVTLSILGFGQGNYNDALMQTLAQNGNGNASYIDNFNEAQKVLVEEASSTLFTIAKDVKIQVEFNPAKVSEYRLIGYETRMLKREDFNNDKIDAGDVGSGHAVTAIYEITPVGNPSQSNLDPLRYTKEDKKIKATKKATDSNEYAYLKMRYKLPKEDKSKLLSLAIDKQHEISHIDKALEDIRFAVSVAAFGQLIKSKSLPIDLEEFSYADIIELANGAKGKDEFGYRGEFIQLLRLASQIEKS